MDEERRFRADIHASLKYKFFNENIATIRIGVSFKYLRALGYISCQKVTYPCKNCGKVYHYYSSLARHLKHECGVEPKFHCPLCPYRTKHKSSLNTHLNGRHMKLLNEFYALPNGNKLSSSMNATN
uniref:longitudinals lacking protein-like n=1 Tax=Vespula vulgaris TaxID=7454 RepID=UPI00223B4A5E|nr:longitudinals lacking protein-like [Vespula vulgaris]